MSEFKAVFDQPKSNQDFYLFLKNIFHLYPEDKFHALIQETSGRLDNDEAIYKSVLGDLPSIKPFLSELTYALPSLREQKAEISRETVELLGLDREFNGYVEIGSTGRYISKLRKGMKINEPIYLINDVEPTYAPPDLAERGQIAKIGTFVELAEYAPISAIGESSVDMVTCYIGLHHCPTAKLDAFMDSIARILRPGGVFVMRDHDVRNPEMHTFVSLVHTVFNLGLKIEWEEEARDTKLFRSAEEWASYICGHGFTDTGKRILQDGDPSLNTLMAFRKK